MAKSKIVIQDPFVARFDRLADDWTSARQRPEAAFVAQFDRMVADWTSTRQKRGAVENAERGAFCERAQSLFDEVRSGIRWRSTAWNFFEVSGRQRQEDAHSHMIAWLMDPAKPHGLRDTFLQAFFERVFGKPAPLGTLECRVRAKKKIVLHLPSADNEA
jgi:hypothetical protein